ncbi:LLM class flavin-dependent oxidoreductase [Kribbella sp. NBC_01505]|uniref:LLM class flavin-dependent oxidoreductase n=1 Tax=Kribbella sp. NBC_01505 TaxID=2903580 RepID=UPI00386D82F7
MEYGFILPGGTAGEQLEQAVLAEQAGWDGVFVWEAAYGVDPWGLLCAVAARTERIRLGTMLTPLPWRRPWKVASQVVTLDQVSGGRATLAVGVGATETDLPRTGEELELRTRAAMLDEGIDLIRELWSGGLSYQGEYYEYNCERDDLAQVGRPVQERIPIWVVGVWPRPKSMRRVLRCDGVLPQFEEGQDTVAELGRLKTWLSEHDAEIDVIAEGEAQDTTAVQPWIDAGATWWLETRWEMPHHSAERMQEVRERIAAGPPS